MSHVGDCNDDDNDNIGEDEEKVVAMTGADIDLSPGAKLGKRSLVERCCLDACPLGQT